MSQETIAIEQLLKEIAAGKYEGLFLIYNRKSIDEADNQKNSISYQKAEGQKFAIKEHLPIAKLTIPGFCTDGIISERHSGFKEDNELTFNKRGQVQYNVNRPKFLKLAQFLSQGHFRGVICLCWDRISRNKGDDTIVRKLMRNGVEFRFVYAKYEKTSSGALHMDIDGMFSEHYSRVTGEKIREVTRNLRDRGIVTYRAPIGYLNQGSIYQKPFDPDRAPLIKKLFELYATGNWSLADLVRFCAEQGFTTPPLRRRRTRQERLEDEKDEDQRPPRISRPLNLSIVHSILTNPFYTGKMMNSTRQYIRSASHEPIVSDQLFNTVQKMLNKKNVSKQYKDKLQLHLRGILRCGSCGRVYTPYMKRGNQYLGTRCVPLCSNPQKCLKLSFIETAIGTIIENLTLTKDQSEQLDDSIFADLAQLEQKRTTDLQEIAHKQKRIKESLKYIQNNKILLLQTGVYNPETLAAEESHLKAELVTLQVAAEKPNRSGHDVAKDLIKLSELVKYGSVLYSFANSTEKEQIINLLFSEFSFAENTLQYKCKNGFIPFLGKALCFGGLKTWLTDSAQSHTDVQNSIKDLEELLARVGAHPPPTGSKDPNVPPFPLLLN